MDKSDTIKGGEDNLNPLDSPDKIRGVTNYTDAFSYARETMLYTDAFSYARETMLYTDAFSYARETMLYTDALIVKLMKEQDNEN